MEILPTLTKTITRVLLAVSAIALSSVILVAFRGFFSTSVVALLYLLVVVLCTSIGEFTAGIVTSILAFLTFNYFFLPPFNTFTVTHTQDTIALFVFLVVSIVISNLMGRAQTRLEQIRVREHEAMHLFELSSTLTAIWNEKQIAQVLSTNRGVLGEIHLWTGHISLTGNEQRLLKTIASQAALAVERALLSKTENRTKILEESDRLKTAILSSVSHDLRTPLASIQAAASSLCDPAETYDPGAKSELQSLLLEETKHLNQLVGKRQYRQKPHHSQHRPSAADYPQSLKSVCQSGSSFGKPAARLSRIACANSKANGNILTKGLDRSII